MRTPAQGILWALRTAVLAVGCTGLAWGGHIAAGGDPGGAASGPALAAATLLTALPLARFTSEQRGFGEIFAVLAAAQVVLHLLFQAAAPATADHLAAMTGGPGSAQHGHALFGYSAGMLVAHLWAALLAAALLSRGEHALWTLLGLIDRAVPALLRAPGTVLTLGTAPRTPGPPAALPRTAAAGRPRTRAPPVRAAA
ncbi:hypothetical protein CLV63_105244 [Murinocardiopsis flavida]|uniref:Uncharacterized protein n=1 Tax=Murinocardiopsis flavida TaxID=645275 RepID=A0A2P8DMX9_9ACTN|nr:hypothetical protein [Murinocardiopsis flavida]PSK98570.1 hypothetical protein CLV63_105244 [Murinocardiopsis flavida]